MRLTILMLLCVPVHGAFYDTPSGLPLKWQTARHIGSAQEILYRFDTNALKPPAAMRRAIVACAKEVEAACNVVLTEDKCSSEGAVTWSYYKQGWHACGEVYADCALVRTKDYNSISSAWVSVNGRHKDLVDHWHDVILEQWCFALGITPPAQGPRHGLGDLKTLYGE